MTERLSRDGFRMFGKGRVLVPENVEKRFAKQRRKMMLLFHPDKAISQPTPTSGEGGEKDRWKGWRADLDELTHVLKELDTHDVVRYFNGEHKELLSHLQRTWDLGHRFFENVCTIQAEHREILALRREKEEARLEKEEAIREREEARQEKEQARQEAERERHRAEQAEARAAVFEAQLKALLAGRVPETPRVADNPQIFMPIPAQGSEETVTYADVAVEEKKSNTM